VEQRNGNEEKENQKGKSNKMGDEEKEKEMGQKETKTRNVEK
jgi:hypothetical protein